MAKDEDPVFCMASIQGRHPSSNYGAYRKMRRLNALVALDFSLSPPMDARSIG